MKETVERMVKTIQLNGHVALERFRPVVVVNHMRCRLANADGGRRV